MSFKSRLQMAENAITQKEDRAFIRENDFFSPVF